MRKVTLYLGLALLAILVCPRLTNAGGLQKTALKPSFHTSDRCLACHNELTTPSGHDVSIGLHWRASIMANSARDPYWQASVRRETIDYPQATRSIEDECTVCHMPVARYEAKQEGREGEFFKFIPFSAHQKIAGAAEDGVTCSVCHQISKDKLGTRESFNGGFVIEKPETRNDHPEYGPFKISPGQQRIMDSSTGGFLPTQAQHIRDSALCGTCHQLYTTARGAGGKDIGYLPEQMPYLEWLHSDYPNKYSCQECHMPVVNEPVQISSALGPPRTGLHQHVFYGGNFLMLGMLNRYRADLDVAALPDELTSAQNGTLAFLQSQSARVSIRHVDVSSDQLRAEVFVENLTGHKLPTAYPSRRAWIHFVVKDRNGKIVFESGALNPDGSIQGNDNDADKERYEPHYREITSADQVEIFEPILKDSEGRVTTGLLAAIAYFKDNRILPTGFDKTTAEKDIAVVGDAADDPNFTGGGASVRYSVSTGSGESPFHIEAELWYQPIGFRWAHNLELYQNAAEPHRFVSYYDSMSSSTAAILARAEATK
ncbi:MAG TPA: hypothetical protein VMT53_25470 [Terriglobales bacterium]|nr:hypothetical protein [Terriglobales bacterium]